MKAFRQDRAVLVGLSFLLGTTVLGGRAVMIHLFPNSSKSLAAVAHRQYQQTLDLASDRGNIYDRKREPLAISVKRPSLVINPKAFQPDRQQLSMLSRILKIPATKIQALKKKSGYFAWLKRKIPDDAALRIGQLEIKGLSQVAEPARFYPGGHAAAQILGFVGSENIGLMGLERKFDRLLRGPAQKVVHSRDALGRQILLGADQGEPELQGHDLHLTLDLALQDIAEGAIEAGVKTSKAKSGFVIVSDPHTGRILALANYPQFDPNAEKKSFDASTANHAVMDIFEPGSVLKPMVVAAALDQGLLTADTVIDCENGKHREATWTINDDHPQGLLSTTEVLVHSSNIGAFKIARLLGPQRLYDSLRSFGIGTGEFQLDLPGQENGRIASPESWKPVRFANIAFGQGMVTTGIEIVQAYGAIANGGNILRPFIVDHLEGPGGRVVYANSTTILRRIMQPQTARTLRSMLSAVVEDGTGKNAQMATYSAGGKTGTSEKIDPLTKTYSTDKRLASFAGFAPASDPYLVIYVVVDEPGVKPYYGGTWAAPVFREIAERSLRYLNVAPDQARALKLAEGL